MIGPPQSLRPADARLLVPAPVRTVRFAGDVLHWDGAVDALGLRETAAHADLAITDKRRAREVSMSADNLLVDGATISGLSAGWQVETILVRTGRNGPRLFVPVRQARAVAHALDGPMVGRSARKRALTRIAVSALARGLPVSRAISIATRTPGLPHLLAEADRAAQTRTREWYLVTGGGDDRQRMVWFCFGDDSTDPSHVVKCSRVPGLRDSLDRDEAALRRLDRLPGSIAAHAPRLLGRADVDGLPVSIETAAAGHPLHSTLRTDPRAAGAVVPAIADWVVAMGEASAGAPAHLGEERARLARDVGGRWNEAGGLVASLPPLQPVLQHNDLGCWNIVGRREAFTAVDWESASAAGFPLWDLVYFLTDALSRLAAPRDEPAREQAMRALLRGELDSSSLFFDRVRIAAHRAGVPRDAIGAVVTLCWLHHGLSAGRREADAGPLSRVASYWMDDSRLGPSWAAFRDTV